MGQAEKGLTGMWQVAGVKNSNSKKGLRLDVLERELICFLVMKQACTSNHLATMHPASIHTTNPGSSLKVSPSCAGQYPTPGPTGRPSTPRDARQPTSRKEWVVQVSGPAPSPAQSVLASFFAAPRPHLQSPSSQLHSPKHHESTCH